MIQYGYDTIRYNKIWKQQFLELYCLNFDTNIIKDFVFSEGKQS
jgi:hypothetical protein